MPTPTQTVPPDLKAAVDKIRADPELTKKFLADPKGTLKSVGVDTPDLKIGPMEKMPVAAMRPVHVCASVGCVVCAEIGGESGGIARAQPI